MDKQRSEQIAKSIIELIPLIRKKFSLHSLFSDYSITPAHFHIILMLKIYGKQTISDVGTKLFISRPNMTPLINKLIEAELVEKEKSQNDKRSYFISLTKKGYVLLDEYFKSYNNYLDSFLNKLNENDLDKLEDSLLNVIEILSKIDINDVN